MDLGIQPLRLCLLRGMPPPSFHPHTTLPGTGGHTLKPMFNISLWGGGTNELEAFIEQSLRFESLPAQLCGRKLLYAYSFYTEAEFLEILYGIEWYDDPRKRYGTTTSLSVFAPHSHPKKCRMRHKNKTNHVILALY